jgi:hypothetical protein
MNSEEALKEKLPLIKSIMEENGIVLGQYSVSTYSLPSGNEYGCQVSPTVGNSSLFTLTVQETLTSSGFSVKTN